MNHIIFKPSQPNKKHFSKIVTMRGHSSSTDVIYISAAIIFKVNLWDEKVQLQSKERHYISPSS